MLHQEVYKKGITMTYAGLIIGQKQKATTLELTIINPQMDKIKE